ncbi:MAG: hypothetical protein M3O50_03200 [Myxococcota bacterium]|nr:hypothetical protein [Myxococcota bacterium]
MGLPAARAPRSRWLVLVVAALPAALAVASCSSSNSPAPAAAEAGALCPATPELANGQACAPEGLRCAPEYACGITTAILVCTCTRGSFQCVDGAGMPVDPGAPPSCPGSPFDAGPCPPTESAAQLAACSAPGQLCAYPSACSGMFDTCQCFAGRTTAGQFGLRFECSARSCLYTEAAAPAGTDAKGTPDSSDAASSPALDASEGGEAATPFDAGMRTEAAADAQNLDATSLDASD